jgi:hypothetical protein
MRSHRHTAAPSKREVALLVLLMQKQVLKCSLLCTLLGLPEYKSTKTKKGARERAVDLLALPVQKYKY